MNRRQLLTFNATSAQRVATLAVGSLATTGLAAYSGAWTKAEVKHLLRRVMFGATAADVEYFAGKTMAQTITELLTAGSTPAPPLYTFSSVYDDPNVPFGQTWVNAPVDNAIDALANGQRLKSYRAWWIGQILNQPRTLVEKMTMFWHNHFATETTVIQDARLCYRYNALLRQYALGNFKALTKAVTLDPGMLIYLNGFKNTNTKPDENYGRELQELFTIGKDENGIPYYSESDVQAAAKVLTGHSINAGLVYAFNSNKHDTTNKTFSAFYNSTVITGQSGGAGANELDSLLNMIFSTQQAAVFLCRKLYRYFIYYSISSDAEANVIQPLATIFRNSNYDIVPVLQALFSSEHFYDVANRGSLIKTPVDFMAGFFRDYGVVFPDGSTSTLLTQQYNLWNKAYGYAASMGQIIGDPPNVAGWPAYYQEPQFHELWINTNTLPARNLFSDLLCTAGFSNSGYKVVLDTVKYTATIDNSIASDPDLLVQEVIDRHYSEDVSQNVKDHLKDYLLSGQQTNSYWTDAWMAYRADPTNNTKYTTVASRLKLMYIYLMDLSEYQLS